jgi:hypothetical protein
VGLGAFLAFAGACGVATAAEEGETKEAPSEAAGERAMLALDLVLGWGKVPFALQNQPVGGTPGVTYSRSDSTESNVQSFLLGGSLEIAEHLGIGARMPFTFASFSPDGSPSRGTSAPGNLELEGEYSAPVAHGLRLIAALGVALPTATGTEIPPGLTNQPAGATDVTAYDRWSLSKAAAYARGYEDNALFEPDRLGLVPKVGLSYRLRGLSIEPHVKVENLIGTTSSLDASYVGELVASLRVGYWVHRQFEVAVKGWVNAGFAGTSDDKTTAASLEPALVLRFGPVRPYAGVIIPLAGPPSDNHFVGLRVGVAAAL